MYSCEIWKGWERVHIKNIFLKVRGKHLPLYFHLSYFPTKKYTFVLCLWSWPLSECKVEVVVNVSFGSSFELKCPVNESLAAPSNISWFWLPTGTPGPVPFGRAKKKGLLLHFHSVDDIDRGWYRCEYNIGRTQRCFEFNLQRKGKFIITFF